MNPHQPHRITAVVAAAAALTVAGLPDSRLTADEGAIPAELIQRVEAQTARPSIALRATRELRASARNGKHLGWMEVETVISPSGSFRWTVIEEGGSERTRNQVFRALLAAEEQACRTGHDDAALTLANYAFEEIVPVGSGQLRIRLRPRRPDPKLIDGTLIVSADGYPIVLEGRLAKSPSFWVKSVSVIKRFGRFSGVALPLTVESAAELKMFGEANFTMRYRYSEVNGWSVLDAIAATPTVESAALFPPNPSRSR
jgi:hypothetical protein